MKNLLSNFCSQFGFDNSNDFGNSLVHINLLWISVPVAAIGTYVEKVFGLSVLTMGAFVILLALEFITGIVASRVKNIKIQSKKFGRFGLKLFIWIMLFFIINSLRRQYQEQTIGEFYGWIHTFIVGYVNMEYLISVLENLAIISGKENGMLVKLLRKKWMNWLDTDEVLESTRESEKIEEDRKKVKF
jgi:phage-related holin